MANRSLVKMSKFLALVLRHNPDAAGLMLDNQGWALVSEVIKGMQNKGHHINRDLLFQIVNDDEKQRYALSPDKKRIRANQGHSVNVDLKMEQRIPPSVLYHGTSADVISLIQKNGIEKRSRQFVHLSSDIETAFSVGRRHGKPIVLVVDAETMHKENRAFYQSANGVWLVEGVDTQYIAWDQTKYS